MTVLETSFLVDIFRNNPTAVELLEELEKNETVLQIAAPTIMELWLGACRSRNSEKEKEKINELIKSFLIMPLDTAGAKEAAEIEAELFQEGQMIELEDIMIAGIARSRGEKVVTRDEHFARIKGLKVWKY